MKSDFPATASISAAQATAEQAQPIPPGSPWRQLESYSVQQAAALTGLSEHTLRYYEKIGLIQPVQRQTSSGHRRYGPDELAKLESLACLRATGMPIDQMRRYFELRSRGADAASEQQALLTSHLQELHRRMAALQTHMDYVALKIDYWRAVEANDQQTATRIAREADALVRPAVLPSQAITDKDNSPA